MQWNPVLAFWAAVVALIYLLFVLHELRARADDTE